MIMFICLSSLFYTESAKWKQNEDAKRSHHVLSEVQGSTGSHRLNLQGWKETNDGERRACTRTEKAWVRRTKIRTSAQVCKNNEKTDVETEVQDLRLHEAQEGDAAQKTRNSIGENEQYEWMGNTSTKTEEQVCSGQVSKLWKWAGNFWSHRYYRKV